MLLRSLIVQLKIIPLPVYLRDAAESETREVIVRLGQCIRNNAATNIFNKDLDSRNYGVGRYGNVFLFDYDAVEKLTDVKIRTNLDREPGEEAVPDWFFEDGVVFLPEELQHGMQLMNRSARKCFREENLDLLSVEYWEEIQQKLLRGEIPELQMFPESCKLDAAPAADDGGLALTTRRAANGARAGARRRERQLERERGAAARAFALGAQSAAEFLRGEGAAVQAETMARGARVKPWLEQPRHVLAAGCRCRCR